MLKNDVNFEFILCFMALKQQITTFLIYFIFDLLIQIKQ